MDVDGAKMVYSNTEDWKLSLMQLRPVYSAVVMSCLFHYEFIIFPNER